jgi:CRISPR-associated endoribonuclease Cas6
MTYLQLLLSPQKSTQTVPNLVDWLTACKPTPVFFPLLQQKQLTKIGLVLPNHAAYPDLITAIVRQILCQSWVNWQGKTYTIKGITSEPPKSYIAALYRLLIPITFSSSPPIDIHKLLQKYCTNWIAQVDATLAHQLVTLEVSPLICTYLPRTAKKGYLCLTVFQAEWLSPLLWGLSHDLGKTVELGDSFCQFSSQLSPFQQSDYYEMYQAPAQSEIKLQFLTPTSFKQNKVIQPFPLAELTFASLQRRWNQLAPKPLKIPEQQWSGLVSAYDLKTEVWPLPHHQELGCVGWIRYRFSDTKQARFAATLAQFANFAGVGRKTALGMGVTRNNS